jgi:hypothetical protein
VNASNPSQTDTDGDRLGDACDNCPMVANFFQEDANMNGTGDHCETTAPVPMGPLCADSTTSSTRLEPNIYLLLDISGSMDDPSVPGDDTSPDRIVVMKQALDAMAATLINNFNVGVGVFPARMGFNPPGPNNTQDECHENLLPDEILDLLENNSVGMFTGSYAPLNANNATPTSTALRRLREQPLPSR